MSFKVTFGHIPERGRLIGFRVLKSNSFIGFPESDTQKSVRIHKGLARHTRSPHLFGRDIHHYINRMFDVTFARKTAGADGKIVAHHIHVPFGTPVIAFGHQRER